MYIKAYAPTAAGTELKDYTALESLIFAPSADVTGAGLPVNAFEADIRTADAISLGTYAELYDDRDNLWAAYWVTESRRLGPELLRIVAESDIARLDRVRLGAIYYENASAATAIAALMEAAGVDYRLDPTCADATLTGFCPAQTGRQRLQWIVFILGATVQTCFNRRVEIAPAPTAVKRIPPEDTYWRPRYRYADWVTGIRAKVYAFRAGDPAPGERFVTSAAGVNYVISETEVTLQNPDAPAMAPENVLSLEGMYLVNAGNVSALLTRLAGWAFRRGRLELDAIDNADYLPGDRVIACAGPRELAAGVVTRAAFRFGRQAMASLTIAPAEDVPGGTLTILYIYEALVIGRADYTLPAGAPYAVDNPYFDVDMGGVRYVFRPVNDRAEGVVPTGHGEDRQPLDVALALEDGVLSVISVDAVGEIVRQ